MTEPGDPEPTDGRGGGRSNRYGATLNAGSGLEKSSPPKIASLLADQPSIHCGRALENSPSCHLVTADPGLPVSRCDHRTVPCSQRSPRSRWRRGREASSRPVSATASDGVSGDEVERRLDFRCFLPDALACRKSCGLQVCLRCRDGRAWANQAATHATVNSSTPRSTAETGRWTARRVA